MIPANNRFGSVAPAGEWPHTSWRAAIMLAAVVILGIIAMAFLGYKTAGAEASGEYGGPAEYAANDSPTPAIDYGATWERSVHANPMSVLAGSPAADPGYRSPQVQESDRSSAEIYVWASRLTMGKAADDLTTYWGYMPSAMGQDNLGSLKPTAFMYQDVDYTVQALVLRQQTDGAQHLVFKSDKRLPDHLTLHIGDDRFPVSESAVMGTWSNMHVWSVGEDLGWTDGRSTYVVLLEPSGGHFRPDWDCLPIPGGCPDMGD